MAFIQMFHLYAPGENIFNTINEEVKKHGLSWDQCIAMGADNANVMSGTKKGVISYIRQHSPQVHFAGCPCHLIHLGAKYASTCLPSAVGDRLIDIFYYLEHSAKRQTELSEVKVDHGVKDLAVLKYCPTRWLSLHACMKRLLELWGPLKAYFEYECSRNNGSSSACERQVRCRDFLKSHTGMAVCFFLDYVLEAFIKANLALQHDKPMVHKSRRIMVDLYKNILLKFIKPSSFAAHPNVMEIICDSEMPSQGQQRPCVR
jgi:hypothetical protein